MKNQLQDALQLELFPEDNSKEGKIDLSSTFADNMSMPVHRWFRYTAGFSANWVRELIQRENSKYVLDPFAGSGTVPIEGELAGVNAIGIEAHPYVYRIACAKQNWKIDPRDFAKAAGLLLRNAKEKGITKSDFPALILKCYPLDTIQKLEALKTAWKELDVPESHKELLWLVITAILRVSSPVGTAQWQYVLPNKTKGKVIDPFQAFELKVKDLTRDMELLRRYYPNPAVSQIFLEDARNMCSVPDQWADLVITSPPYANNYDYADATRLEMTFWGDIESWGDLQEKVRQYLVAACTQQVAHIKDKQNKY